MRSRNVEEAPRQNTLPARGFDSSNSILSVGRELQAAQLLLQTLTMEARGRGRWRRRCRRGGPARPARIGAVEGLERADAGLGEGEVGQRVPRRGGAGLWSRRPGRVDPSGRSARRRRAPRRVRVRCGARARCRASRGRAAPDGRARPARGRRSVASRRTRLQSAAASAGMSARRSRSGGSCDARPPRGDRAGPRGSSLGARARSSVAVGGGDHAHVHGDRARRRRAACTCRSSSDAQQLGLRGERQVADLVEEEGAAVGRLEAAARGRGRRR